MRLRCSRFAVLPSSRLGKSLCVELQGSQIDSREVPGRQARMRHIGMKRRCAPCVQRSGTADRTMKACTRTLAWVSACAGCRSSISRPDTSRSTTKTGQSGWFSTARSTTTRLSAANSRAVDTASTPRATPKPSSTHTKSGVKAHSFVSAACSRSPCGTVAQQRCCSPGTGSESSRCTTPAGLSGCISARRSRPFSPSWRKAPALDVEALDHYLSYSVHAARRLDLPGCAKAAARKSPPLAEWQRAGPAVLGGFGRRGAFPHRTKRPPNSCGQSWTTPCDRTS